MGPGTTRPPRSPWGGAERVEGGRGGGVKQDDAAEELRAGAVHHGAGIREPRTHAARIDRRTLVRELNGHHGLVDRSPRPAAPASTLRTVRPPGLTARTARASRRTARRSTSTVRYGRCGLQENMASLEWHRKAQSGTAVWHESGLQPAWL